MYRFTKLSIERKAGEQGKGKRHFHYMPLSAHLLAL